MERFPPRRRKSAAERRSQYQRADAQVVAKLLKGFMNLDQHRGSQLNKATQIFVEALNKVGPHGATSVGSEGVADGRGGPASHSAPVRGSLMERLGLQPAPKVSLVLSELVPAVEPSAASVLDGVLDGLSFPRGLSHQLHQSLEGLILGQNLQLRPQTMRCELPVPLPPPRWVETTLSALLAVFPLLWTQEMKGDPRIFTH